MIEATNQNKPPSHFIGEYAVLDLLGSGGFGSVYRVKKRTAGQSYLAMKEVSRVDRPRTWEIHIQCESYSVVKTAGCATGHWKLDPERLRQKWYLGTKIFNSGRTGTQIPQKDCVQSSEGQTRGSKRRHIYITQHGGSTLPGVHLRVFVFWEAADGKASLLCTDFFLTTHK